MSVDMINVIFGMKVRQARQEAGLSLKEFASQAKLSASYVTEIEKGRKYPRANKIIKMAKVLGKRYDDLVSITLDSSLAHLGEALESPLLQHFPFDEFDLDVSDFIELLTRSPDKASALLHAFLEEAQGFRQTRLTGTDPAAMAQEALRHLRAKEQDA